MATDLTCRRWTDCGMTTDSWRRVWRSLGVIAAMLGSQSLVAALPRPGHALMLLPSEGAIAGLGDGLRRGFLLAQEQSRLCSDKQTDWSIGWLSPGADLTEKLRHRALPPLLVAPPAAALVPTGLLAERRQRQVLLPLQRGISLQQLASRPGSDRLWPVSASRSLEIDVLVKALLEQKRLKFMLITDGTADQQQLADRFLETMGNQGGELIGLEPSARIISGDDTKAVEQLAFDVDWFRPLALVVMTSENSSLMQEILKQRWPETMQLVWNVSPRHSTPTSQLGVDEANRGPGWDKFSGSFKKRFGYEPGMIEASGYDAGQLVALSVMNQSLSVGQGMKSFDSEASIEPYCKALSLAASGKGTRTNGASSNMDMKAATPPTAILEVIQKDANGVESRTTYNLGAN